MIFRRRHRNTDVPGLNTASLPDLIFTVLFFFMIVTNMRHDEVMVRYTEPDGTHLSKFKAASTATNIYIGRKIALAGETPLAGEIPQMGEISAAADGRQDSAAFVIQVDSRMMPAMAITSYIREKKKNMAPADAAKMVVNIRADKDVPMSMLRQVKESLKKADALIVHYSANEKD